MTSQARYTRTLTCVAADVSTCTISLTNVGPLPPPAAADRVNVGGGCVSMPVTPAPVAEKRPAI